MTPFLLLACVLLPDLPDDVPLSGTEVPGLAVVSVEHYRGRALYGYIDWGADLYHEYGFVRLVVERCTLRSESLTLEVHEMTDEVAALGIFSVSSSECDTLEALGPFSCVSAEVVQWASSRYFVRVMNTSGSAGGRDACLILARAVQAKLGGRAAEVPATLAAMRAPIGGLKVMRGPLGLENGFDRWSAFFGGIDRFDLFVLPVTTTRGHAVVAEARFTKHSDAEKFSARMSQTTAPDRSLWQRDSTRVIVLEATALIDSLRVILENCP